MSQTPKIVVAYFTAWSIYGRSYFVSDIDGTKLTHINYAFANIGADGTVVLGDSWADVEKTFDGDTWDQPLKGNFNQLLKLKQKYPHLRTLISVGGWVSLNSSIPFVIVDLSRHGLGNFLTLLLRLKVEESLLNHALISFKSMVLMGLISIGKSLLLSFDLVDSSFASKGIPCFWWSSWKYSPTRRQAKLCSFTSSHSSTA